MPKNSLNVSLKGADDIFSTEESRQEQQREQVQQIPIGELFPFKNHPFKVLDDESMQRTVESVEQYGVLSPLIARPRPEGGYEIISGHRRQHAAQLAGLETLPVIVREMSDDAAVILMVDSNALISGVQLDTILYFEDWADTWFEGHKDNIAPTTQESYPDHPEHRRPCRHRDD